MKLTVSSTLDGSVYSVEVADDMEIMNVKALLEAESGLPAEQMELSHQLTTMNDGSRTLSDYGVSNDSLVQMTVIQEQRQPIATAQGSRRQPDASALPEIDWSSISLPGASNAAAAPPAARQQAIDPENPLALREALLSDVVQAQMLSERNPALYEALVSGDPQKFVAEMERQRRLVEEENCRRIRMLAADPFDIEAQTDIAENIRMENVDANMHTAMEHNPEAFGQVVMLYIQCKVNGHPVKAFVDSGAQMTIMSAKCAERCNVTRLVDRRWAGVARGVGTQRIIGRIHLGQLQIEEDFLQASFSVLEEQHMDVLIGLDMLKRHQCCIDLHRNVLRIGTTGTETSFLAEKDLPEDARLSQQAKALSPKPATDAREAEDRQLAEALAKSQEDSLAPSQPANSSAAPSSSFPEGTVTRLVQMGYPHDDVIKALQDTHGNAEQAAINLFVKFLSSNTAK